MHSQKRCFVVSTCMLHKSNILLFLILYLISDLFVGMILQIYLYWTFLNGHLSMVEVYMFLYTISQFISLSLDPVPIFLGVSFFLNVCRFKLRPVFSRGASNLYRSFPTCHGVCRGTLSPEYVDSQLIIIILLRCSFTCFIDLCGNYLKIDS